jgi:hypothetical protein
LRSLLILSSLVWTANVDAGDSIVKLPTELRVRVGRLARIEAVSASPVRWINLHDDLDLIPDSSGKYAMLLGVKAGQYKIAAYTGSKDGPSEPVYCIIIVEAGAAPPAPKPNVDQARAATVRIRFGNAGCTATIIGPRRADGKWDLLTAAHCMRSAGAKGTVMLADGSSLAVVAMQRSTSADLAWLVTESADRDELPFAMLDSADAPPGTVIWHCGFGIDKPGNKETGRVLDGPDANGQLRMELSVSSGDSGSGIFRSDNGQLVAVVCCTSGMARVANVWGGAASAALRLRPSAKALRLTD